MKRRESISIFLYTISLKSAYLQNELMLYDDFNIKKGMLKWKMKILNVVT